MSILCIEWQTQGFFLSKADVYGWVGVSKDTMFLNGFVFTNFVEWRLKKKECQAAGKNLINISLSIFEMLVSNKSLEISLWVEARGFIHVVWNGKYAI